MTRSVTSETNGAVLETQEWSFQAAGGERIAMTIIFERGVPNRGNQNEVRFYSAQDPSLSQISRQERVLEILRNVTTTPPDRVREFSFDAGGGSYAAIFDGTEEMLSWDNIMWVYRSVLQP
jgi:hypothetical protein